LPSFLQLRTTLAGEKSGRGLQDGLGGRTRLAQKIQQVEHKPVFAVRGNDKPHGNIDSKNADDQSDEDDFSRVHASRTSWFRAIEKDPGIPVQTEVF